jgi:hypothetical protein
MGIFSQDSAVRAQQVQAQHSQGISLVVGYDLKCSKPSGH